MCIIDKKFSIFLNGLAYCEDDYYWSGREVCRDSTREVFGSTPMDHCRRGADQGFLRSNQGNKWLVIVYERSLKVVCNFYSSKRDLQNQID